MSYLDEKRYLRLVAELGKTEFLAKAMKTTSCLLALFFSTTILANYNVSRLLDNQAAHCPATLLYTTDGDTLSGHPRLNMPRKFTVVMARNGDLKPTATFVYQGFHRSWDSLVSVYKSEQGDVIFHDDACWADQTLIECLELKGCQYRY